jgi:hypothetical protein
LGRFLKGKILYEFYKSPKDLEKAEMLINEFAWSERRAEEALTRLKVLFESLEAR